AGVMLAGAFASAKHIGATRTISGRWRTALAAGGEALGLRYLRGGTGGGCYYPSQRTSNTRLVLHMLVFYGFISALIATLAAAILQDVFDQLPPYPMLSVPVVLGSVGGAAMMVAATGLLNPNC